MFDSFVFVMTVYKTLSLRRISGISLIDLLLRDGKSRSNSNLSSS